MGKYSYRQLAGCPSVAHAKFSVAVRIEVSMVSENFIFSRIFTDKQFLIYLAQFSLVLAEEKSGAISVILDLL
jgi:hypothetical protein